MPTMHNPPHSASILVIDDYLLMRKNLENILELAGYQVQLASCATDGLRALHTTEINLVITDILLPGLSGLAFYEQVKSRDRWQQIPFIFLSGSAGELAKVHARYVSDRVTCMLKPFAVQGLLDAVAQALSPAAAS